MNVLIFTVFVMLKHKYNKYTNSKILVINTVPVLKIGILPAN